MKTSIIFLSGLMLMACAGESGQTESESMAASESTAQSAEEKKSKDGILELGKSLPAADVKMKHIDGSEHSLRELAGEEGLLVIFSCNTCPFVVGNQKKSEGWEGRYPALFDHAEQSSIGMALINSNEAKRDAGDGLEDMKERYEQQGLKGAYLLDENHVVADAFGALTTPHVFLFNKDMELVYKGAIDDSVDSPDEVKNPYVMNAMSALVAGQAIDPNSTKQLGCSIKRVKA